MKRSALATLAVMIFAGCDSTTAPTALADFYQATTLNDVPLPVRAVDSFTNTAGSCEVDLDGADLMFYASDSFDLYLNYLRRCSSEIHPVRATVRIQGDYTYASGTLVLQPITQSTERIERVEVRGRNILIDIQRGSGTAFRLRFAPAAIN